MAEQALPSISLELLCVPLTTSGVEELDALDQRLVTIDALAAKARFAEAAVAVQELVRSGVYDVRPLPYLLYQSFVQDGFSGLATALEALENLLGPSLAALTPVRRRNEFVNKRTAWLFDTLHRAIEYHERFATPEWSRLSSTLMPPHLDRVLAAGTRVAMLLGALASPLANTALGQLLAQIRAYRQALDTPSAESATATSNPSPVVDPPNPNPLVCADFSPHSGHVRMDLLVAPPFIDLCCRLKAFEVLVERRQFRKAAVLVEAIGRAIQDFDPRFCFPELFGRFAALQSKHAVTLAEEGQEPDSPLWKALAQFARVDLARFLED